MARTDNSSQIKQSREQPLSPKPTFKSTRKRKATPKAAEALLAAKKTKTQSKLESFDPKFMKNKESEVDSEVKKTVPLKKRKPRKGSKKKTDDPEKEDLKTEEEDSRDVDKVVTSKGYDCLATNDKLIDVMKAKIVTDKMEDDIDDSSGDENCEYVDVEVPTKEADVCTKLKNPEISRKDFADDVVSKEVPLKIFEQAVTVNKEQRQKTPLYRKDLLDFEEEEEEDILDDRYQNIRVNSPSIPTLVEQFNKCLFDFFINEPESYQTLTSNDKFVSLSEFFFGGEFPMYDSLDSVLGYSTDEIENLSVKQYNKYKVFFESDFRTSESFKKYLDTHDITKHVLEPPSPVHDSLGIDAESSFLNSIIEGTTSISTLSSSEKDIILISTLKENRKFSKIISGIEEELSMVKTELRKFVIQSTSHINKLATSKNEAKTQSSVQKFNGAYGEGVWFPLIRDPSIERLPNHDEYEPKVVKGTTLKWHKETDVNKKKWWAQAKYVEKGTVTSTDHFSAVFKKTFSKEEFAMLRQYYGMTKAENKKYTLTIPTNLMNAANDLAGFIAFASNQTEALSKTKEDYVGAMKRMFTTGHYYAKKKFGSKFKFLTTIDASLDTSSIDSSRNENEDSLSTGGDIDTNDRNCMFADS